MTSKTAKKPKESSLVLVGLRVPKPLLNRVEKTYDQANKSRESHEVYTMSDHWRQIVHLGVSCLEQDN